jgi:hypothetical protein
MNVRTSLSPRRIEDRQIRGKRLHARSHGFDIAPDDATGGWKTRR